MTTETNRRAYQLAAMALKRDFGSHIGIESQAVLTKLSDIHSALKAASLVENGPGIDEALDEKPER